MSFYLVKGIGKVCMVKEVFINLQEDKKEKILQSAKTEFINNGFMGAKVSRICEQAGIPRSAFYRYFDSIEDVFQLIMEHYLMKRMIAFRLKIASEPESVFDICREMLVTALDSKEDRLLVESISLFNGIQELEKYRADMVQTLPQKTSLLLLNFMCLVKDFVNLHQKQGVPKDMILQQYDDVMNLLKKGYDNI